MNIESVTMLEGGQMAVKFQGKKRVSVFSKNDKVFQAYTIWYILNRDSEKEKREQIAKVYNNQ